MTDLHSPNTEKLDDNATFLSRSALAKFHRKIILKRSKFNKLVTDKNKKILEIGCGSGATLAYFSSRGFRNLYAIEPDVGLIKKIPGNIKAEIKNCRAKQIDFEDSTFDAVFIYGVLHHLTSFEGYNKGCNEIYRVLKPGGVLFIMEPGRYLTFRAIEIASKYLGLFSSTLKAFSECLEEEKKEQHFFLKNHNFFRSYFNKKNFEVIVDKYFLYTWLFTARKGE